MPLQAESDPFRKLGRQSRSGSLDNLGMILAGLIVLGCTRPSLTASQVFWSLAGWSRGGGIPLRIPRERRPVVSPYEGGCPPSVPPIPATPPIAGALSLSVGGIGGARIAPVPGGVHGEGLWPLVIGYLGSPVCPPEISSHRWSFYLGLLAGLGVLFPKHSSCGGSFSVAAIPLWIILALFHAAFVLVLGRVEERWGSGSRLGAPIVWCRIEHFRIRGFGGRGSPGLRPEAACLPPGARGPRAAGVHGFRDSGNGGGRHTLRRMVESVRCAVLGRRGCFSRESWAGRRRMDPTGLAPGRPPSGEEVPVAGSNWSFRECLRCGWLWDGLARTHPDAQLAMLSEPFDGEIPAP